MRRILWIACLLMWNFIDVTYGQSERLTQSQYRFKYITVDQGLSNNRVNSICQDARGIIWIATPNGVDLFNGQKIVSHKHDPQDSSTISSNVVNQVYLDSKKNLWICTDVGLDRYDPQLDNFKRFSHRDIDQTLGSVNDVVEDKKGILWIGTSSGLYAYNQNTSDIKHFSIAEDNLHGLPPSPIVKLLADRNNQIWIAFSNNGLCLHNPSEGTFRYFKNDPEDPSTLSDNDIERLYEDSQGNIWIGTYNHGINSYVPQSNTFIRVIPDSTNSYSTRVRAIFEDLKGNFFIGTRGGLYIHDPQDQEYDLYAFEGHSFSSLSQNSIRCSFIDSTGTLWIGTHSGGINYTDLKKKEFIHYKAGKDDNRFLNGSNIYAIREDQAGNMWIGGDNGLNYLDRTTHTFRYYTNNPDDPFSLSYNDVKALELDKDGNLWIGTNRGGLNYLDIATGKFRVYRHDPDDPNSLSGDKIYGLLSDKYDNLWIITNPVDDNEYQNIDILPEGSDRFIHLNEGAYYGFDQDEQGNVYIGGISGFWIFKRNDSLYHFISNEELIAEVNAITLDSEGRIWVGSRKGLVRYDRSDDSFTSYSEDNGYPINEVFGILEDKNKSLWVSTNFGLVKITNIVKDHRDIKFRVFDYEDGLQSKQFNYNAYFKSITGEMAFGGINGFNTFYPDAIEENTVPPKVLLTDLRIFNASTPVGEKVGDRIILTKSISVTERIKLGRQQNVFTLEFAAVHYANPEKNTFKFMLEGFDKDWQIRKAENNFATYSNLPAGEYTFLVTAANSDGVWNEVPVELRIKIIPPFWKTWWFFILVAIAVVGSVWLIINIRERQSREDRARLENELNTGKGELENQKSELQKKEEALMAKEEAEAIGKWHNEGIARFSELITSNKENAETLTRQVLSNLISYIGADQGAIFLINDDPLSGDDMTLELVASYAFTGEQFEKRKVYPGEGLVGTCYSKCEIQKIDNLPPDYSYITSGLGKAPPRYLVLLPIRLAEFVVGVLELASFDNIENYKIDFIEKVTENLASVISIVRGSEQARTAMLIANEQKEELLAQEEEIRQNMEEMQATQDELLRKQGQFSTENAILGTLLDFLQDRITIKDAEGVYLRVNKVKSDALKLKDPADAIGLTDATFFGEEHFQRALAEEKKLLKSGKAILNNEEQIKYNDGRVQWGSTSRIPFRDPAGNLIGTLIITKNITEKKFLTGSLDSHNSLLKELTSLYPLIYYETNHTGSINQIFGQGMEILGLKAEEMEEATLFSIFEDLDPEDIRENLRPEYILKYKGREYKVIHRIIPNTATGGMIGCAEVRAVN